MTRIFISHSTKDIDFVRLQLNPQFERAGTYSWCSSTDMQAAADWQMQIRKALAQADWFIVVLSPDAEQSEWVRAETHWALEHLKGRVIPVMARSCDPGDVHLRLATIQYIDFRSAPNEAGQRLLELIQGLADDDSTCLTAKTGLALPAETILIRPQPQATVSLSVDAADAPSYETRLLIKNWAIVGRSDEADLRLPDPCISRKHARFNLAGTASGVGVTLTDLGSANGTFVNRKRILADQPIQAGDLIEIGNARIRVLGIT